MNRIRELRKKAGYSQKDLADILGVGQTAISAWEIGRNEPRISTYFLLSKFFGCSLDYIMGYESEVDIEALEEVADRFYQNLACG